MSDSVTNDPLASQSWWVGVLGSLVLLVVGIVSVFHVNLDKNALTGLVPAAAFIASAIVAAVHVHSSSRVAVARIQARVAMQDITMRNQQHTNTLTANAKSLGDVEEFARKVAATVREDLDRASTQLEPYMATITGDFHGVEDKAREVAKDEVGKLEERLQQIEAWLQPKAQAPASPGPVLPSVIPGGAPDSTSAPVVTAPLTSSPPEYSAVPGAPVPTGPATPAVPTVAAEAVA